MGTFEEEADDMAEKKTPTRRTVAKPKREMLEAYAEALPLVEEKREAELKPEERIAERAAKKVVEVADSVSLDGVLKEVGTFKLEVGKVLAGLTDRLEQEVGKYEAVRKAIAVKEKELEEIYEIQKAASSLAALLEAQAKKREEFEAQAAEARESSEQEMAAARALWEAEKARFEAELKERKADEANRRQREQDEFQYALSREQQMARDRFEAEKAKLEEEKQRLERDLTLRREQGAKELTDREQAIRASEAELEDLRRRVAAFPKELETAVAREVKLSVERARAEAASREELLSKQSEGERNVLKTRIAALETTVKEQADHLARLSLQVERSYGQIQDIAVKAIQGSAAARAFSGQPSSAEPRPAAQEK